MAGEGPISSEDGVVVHGYLLSCDANNFWFALGDDRHLLAARGADAILQEVASTVGSDDDIETLRAKLARAIESGQRQREEDDLYKQRQAERRRAHG